MLSLASDWQAIRNHSVHFSEIEVTLDYSPRSEEPFGRSLAELIAVAYAIWYVD